MNSRLIQTNIRGFAVLRGLTVKGTEGTSKMMEILYLLISPHQNRLKGYSKDLSISLYVIFNLIWKYKYTHTHTHTHIHIYIFAKLNQPWALRLFLLTFYFFFGSNIFYFHITGEDKDTIPLVREQFITLLIFYNSISIILNIL